MIAHLDCTTGVSGDKFLGALLAVGEQTGAFTALDLSALAASLLPEAAVEVSPVVSRGVTALGVSVRAVDQPHHRSMGDIRALIGQAALPDTVHATALRVFEELAAAEAKVHGCPPDDVHFHEVGALDSVVDVVGVCAGVAALGIERLTASVIATGWGDVATSHGTLAVPAPATALLLMGVPTAPGPAPRDGSAPGELTTPTGAALVRVLAGGFGPQPPMTARFSGHGAGTRDVGHPNVCRLTLGHAAAPEDDPGTGKAGGALPGDTGGAREPVTLLETNLDHLPPEAVAFACEELLGAGALDVWTTPVTMKKGRSAVVVSVLCRPVDAARLTARIHELTGSLGVRVSELTRSVVDREVVTVHTEWGSVRYKRGAGRSRPEHDDIAEVARRTGRPYDAVARELGDADASDASRENR